MKCRSCGYESGATEFYQIETPNYIFDLCLECATKLEMDMMISFDEEQRA